MGDNSFQEQRRENKLCGGQEGKWREEKIFEMKEVQMYLYGSENDPLEIKKLMQLMKGKN